MNINNNYNRAEKILQRDKFNNANQMQLFVKDLETFLRNYLNFEAEDYIVTTFVSDRLVINVQVKIRNFVDIKSLPNNM